MAETIKDIADQLSGIFRHIVPGFIVVGAARVSHPDWFDNLNLSYDWHIVVLGAITVVTGNVWYVLHRYTVHQVIDLILFKVRRGCKEEGYVEWLADFIDRGFRAEAKAKKLREHLDFRSSQIILMFIVSEVLFLFTLWYDPKVTFIAKYRWELLIASVLIFGFSVWQYYISNTLDFRTVDNYEPRKT